MLSLITASAAAQEQPSESDGKLLRYAHEVAAFQQTSVYQRNADALNQMVIVRLNDVSRRDALMHIASLGGFRVSFRPDRVPLNEPVTLHLERVSVMRAMHEAIRGSNLGLKLSYSGQFIVVNRKDPVVETPGRLGKADPGQVLGRVTDAETGAPLSGASIRLDGTAFGAATDPDGNYRIPNVPAGEQVLVVSFVGYKPLRVPVMLPPGEILPQDTELSLNVMEGQEVVITAQAEGQVAAINQQLASNTIVNLVSDARIQELPDVNAAEALGRLPGISIVRDAGEGQKVVIRGLSPKFNNVLVNRHRIPATDFNDRSTDLSMISSDMVAGIEVVKAITPDRDADMIGGTVNFRLMDAPAGFRSDVRIQTGYNDQQVTYGTYRAGVSASNRFLGNRLGIMAQANVERADRSSDVFNAGYVRRKKRLAQGETVPIEIQSVGLIDRSETRDRRGASVVVDYRLRSGRVQLSNFVSRLQRDESRWTKGYLTDERLVSYTVRDRDVTVDVLTNAVRAEHNVMGSSFDWSLSHSVSRQHHPYDNAFLFSEVAAFDNGLILNQGPEVISRSAKNRLDETFLQDGDFRTVRMVERDLAGDANLELPFVLGRQLTGYAKLGGKYRSKRRSNDEDAWFLPFAYGPGQTYLKNAFKERDFALTKQGRLAITSFLDEHRSTSRFLKGQYEMNALLDRDFMAETYERLKGKYFRTRFTDLADFQTTEDIAAGYVMAEINLGRRLMILPGLRYELTHTNYEASTGQSDNERTEVGWMRDTTSTQSFDEWFPMVHVRYRFTDWLDLRLARTRSLARPDYSLYSPRRRIQETERRVDRGNAALRPATAESYDALVSFYPGRLGLFTVAGFFKEIEDVIYVREKTVLQPQDDHLPAWTRGFRLTEPVNNPFRTTIKGIEVEWQTHFTYLPGLLSGLVLNVNYARITSDTRYPRSILERNAEPPFSLASIDTFRTGRMIDQPSHIANFSLGYDRGGFSGRISMLYQESSLGRLGDYPEEDAFTQTYVRWDAMAQQRVGTGLSIFLTLNNFLDRPDQSFLGVGFPTTQEFYGWTADLGIRYRY